MIQKELVETLRALNRADKLHVMQLLVSELAWEETDLIQPGLDYPVWSPELANPEQGQTLMAFLAECVQGPGIIPLDKIEHRLELTP